MYPNLYYAFQDLFGVEWPALRFINSFGFFVAWAFLAAAYVLTQELKRKERAGLMRSQDTKIVVGRPATGTELLLNFLLGFVLGYKIVGLFFLRDNPGVDPQEYIFSGQGNWLTGIMLGIVFAGLKWFEKNKQKLAKPEERIIRIWPHDRVGDIVILAAVFGFLGAKIFHNLENWNEFWQNPVEALLSFSGLTFYGGLICAAFAIIYYARKHKISVRHMCDAFAPALLLAYAVGRIGCQVSGDGDWGIMNSAYVSTAEGKVIKSDSATFEETLKQNIPFFKQYGYTNRNDVHEMNVTAPSWVPTWFVAYNYPHNVISEGVPISGCEGQYCNQLPVPAFPTPLYETIACLLLTGFLLFMRRKIAVPGGLFALYLIVNGLERFFIEKIRVNTKYDIFGFHPTQAEIISTLLVITGIALFFILRKKSAAPKQA